MFRTTIDMDSSFELTDASIKLEVVY